MLLDNCFLDSNQFFIKNVIFRRKSMSKRYSFKNDYSEGAHHQILNLLESTNFEQLEGYGLDVYSDQARDMIRQELNDDSVDIHFVSGGTQANLIVLGSLLRPHHSIIAPQTAHINVHETGAIELTGHKINAVSSLDGKITPEQIQQVLDFHPDDEHMVKPKLVFISNSTELGTIYTKKELEQLSEFCHSYGLYLYIDGARLGTALMADGQDLTMSDLTSLLDVFYIGGTKNGALLGEAIVIANPELKEDFRYFLKQRGALLAKGRILALQFIGLFKDGLYYSLARHANELAQRLAKGIMDLGYQMYSQSPTNQIFPIFPNHVIDQLWENYDFYVWTKIDEGSSAVRLVTSWATPEKCVDGFLEKLSSLTQ